MSVDILCRYSFCYFCQQPPVVCDLSSKDTCGQVKTYRQSLEGQTEASCVPGYLQVKVKITHLSARVIQGKKK